MSMGGWCDDASNNHIVSAKRMLASAGTGWLPRLYRHQVFYDRVVTMYYEEFRPYLRALTGLEPDGVTVPLLERLIEIFTDRDDVVIDPCAGSGTTLLAAMNKMRRAYGFEIKKDFYKDAVEKVLRVSQPKLF